MEQMVTPSGEDASHHNHSLKLDEVVVICEASTDLATKAKLKPTCEASTSNGPALPLMADIMSGPNAPLSKGFLMAQWRTIPVDRIFGAHHDLSDDKVQMHLHNMLPSADFIWAALDCSTKARCRNIPSKIPGKNLPPPLRSDEHPMGLPGLQGSDK